MSKQSKVILGICTFLPLVFGIMFMVYYFMIIGNVIQGISGFHDPKEAMPSIFSRFFGSTLLFLLLSVVGRACVTIYYIILAVKTEFKTETEKILWILLFIFVGTVAAIVYFFARVVPMLPKNEIAGNV